MNERYIIFHGTCLYYVNCADIKYAQFDRKHEIKFILWKDNVFTFSSLQDPDGAINSDEKVRIIKHNTDLYRKVCDFIFEGDGEKTHLEINFSKHGNEFIETKSNANVD
jgi:hypothetical protein